ncbi:hypothetical protein [Kutzneria chonburiensis]|uniref:Uncharacterized protein n=1 Tax=Kutzneria chonburiensis TaxID=1483604 RepID=A0ABV6N577_9PSEU
MRSYRRRGKSSTAGMGGAAERIRLVELGDGGRFVDWWRRA